MAVTPSPGTAVIVRARRWLVQPAGEVFVGVDMGKEAHYAQVIGPDGKAVFDRPVPNDEGTIRLLIADAAPYLVGCFGM
jgi:hypothetical protein